MSALQIITVGIASTAAPTQGVPPINSAASGYLLKKHTATDKGFRDRDDELIVAINATRTGGTVLSASFRIWVYSIATALWYPIGIGGDTTKGTINAGSAIGEYATNLLAHWERVAGFKDADGVYLQIASLVGTPDANGINAWLIGRG